MAICKYTVLFWAVLLAAAAVAGHPEETRMKIVIDGEQAGEQAFRFDSEDAGFDLGSLAVGESHQVTDASGNVATILRTTDGFEIDVAGEKIVLGDLGNLDAMAVQLHVDDHEAMIDTDVEVREVRKIRVLRDGDEDGVTVISPNPIDEATRQRIREALQEAGVGGGVEFIDGSKLHVPSDAHAKGGHEVHIIRQQVDVAD